MASDIYQFKAVVNGRELEISVCDLGYKYLLKHNHNISSILSHFKVAGDLAEYFEDGIIRSDDYDEFLEECIIVPHDTPIVYLGGYCVSGYSWNCNDVCTYLL